MIQVLSYEVILKNHANESNEAFVLVSQTNKCCSLE